MKSHLLAYEGQYICQRGCKDKFITLKALDVHHKNKHSRFRRREPEYRCNACALTFKTRQQLTFLMNSDHTMMITSICKSCDYVENNARELRAHIEEYHIGFHQTTQKICRYFVTVACVKGNDCRFEHPRERANKTSTQSNPPCRNGAHCNISREVFVNLTIEEWETKIIQTMVLI